MLEFDPEQSGPPISPTLWYRRLVGRWKWPGWAAIGLGSLRLFHLSEDIDFALGVVRSIGGDLGMLAAVVASPFFAVGLVIYGVAHLIFVGEPKRTLKHYAWVYVGWSVVAFCLTSIVGIAIWGGIQAYIAKEVSTRVEERFWRLSDRQKTSLAEALDRVPTDQRFPVFIRVVMANAQALTMTNDLAEIFNQHGWTLTGTQDTRLRADLLGINFVTAIDWGRIDKDLPPHAAELVHIFLMRRISSIAELGILASITIP